MGKLQTSSEDCERERERADSCIALSQTGSVLAMPLTSLLVRESRSPRMNDIALLFLLIASSSLQLFSPHSKFFRLKLHAYSQLRRRPSLCFDYWARDLARLMGWTSSEMEEASRDPPGPTLDPTRCYSLRRLSLFFFIFSGSLRR